MPGKHDPVSMPRVVNIASAVIIIAALYFAADLLLPIALAILLTFLLVPVVSRMERHGLPRIAAVCIVAIFTAAAIGMLGYVVFGQLSGLAAQLPYYKDNITERLRSLGFAGDSVLSRAAQTLEEIGREVRQPRPEIPTTPLVEPQPDPVLVEVAPPPSSMFDSIVQTLGPLMGPVSAAGVTALLVVFMLILREDMRDRFIRLMGLGRIDMTTRAMDEAAQRISRYLLMQLIINATYGLPVGIALYIIGVPNAVLWGVLAMLLRFIPFLGPWLAALLPILLSLAVFDSWVQPLMVIGVFLVLELISNNVIEPWLYGSKTGLSPMAVIVAAIFWTWLWGPVGLILSTPITACLAVLGRYSPQLHVLHILLSDEPGLEQRSRLYQRLLAMDHDEAMDLVEEELEHRPLVTVYDEVVIPALHMAERDRHRGRLSEHAQQFIRKSVGEMVRELGESKMELEVRIARATKMNLESSAYPATPLPEKVDVPVLCLPASDDADELVARMLAQTLKVKGFNAVAGSVQNLASERLEQVASTGAKVVCISAMPPGSARHARYLCKRLGSRFPQLKRMIGVWDVHEDPKALMRRLGTTPDDGIVTTLAGALESVRRLVQPMLVTRHD